MMDSIESLHSISVDSEPVRSSSNSSNHSLSSDLHDALSSSVLPSPLSSPLPQPQLTEMPDDDTAMIDKIFDDLYEPEVRKIMQQVDADNDGYISYEDMLLSYVSLTLSQKEERMYEAFCKLDVDKNGRVELCDLINSLSTLTYVTNVNMQSNKQPDLNELSSVARDANQEHSQINGVTSPMPNSKTDGILKFYYTPEELKQMLDEVDVDADGLVSFDDFLEIMWENHRIYIQEQQAKIRTRRAKIKKKKEKEKRLHGSANAGTNTKKLLSN
jgi:Ca2+-binding EF-hand superfamily protein